MIKDAMKYLKGLEVEAEFAVSSSLSERIAREAEKI